MKKEWQKKVHALWKEKASPLLTRSRAWYREFSALLLFALGVLCFSFSFYLYSAYVPNQALTVTFFDVGQGDAVSIESPTRTRVLVDGGPSRTVLYKLGTEIPFFDRQIDLVSPTHADADHLFGANKVLETFPVTHVGTLHAPSDTSLDDEYNKGVEWKDCVSLVAGDSIDIGDGATLSVLLPYDGETFSSKETNESSQVLLLTYQGFSFLLTGDLPEERERFLVSSGLLPERLSVLKLGHHGSKGSSGALLLQKTKPWYAVVSAGKGNRYGHPHKETLERVEKVGSVLLRTDEMGDITFRVKGGKMEVSYK